MWAHRFVCSSLLLKTQCMHVCSRMESIIFCSVTELSLNPPYTGKHSLSSALLGFLCFPVWMVILYFLTKRFTSVFICYNLLLMTNQNLSKIKNVFS